MDKIKYLSICSIFKNEENYIEEWIQYHIIAGVEHFYLYNNDHALNDTYKNIFIKYEKYITVHNIPGPARQYDAYNHCNQQYGKENRWIAFIDIDEFLVPCKQDIKNTLFTYEEYDAIGVNWLMFGSDNHEKAIDNYSVINRFTSCCTIDSAEDYSKKVNHFNESSHVKSIVDPKKILGFNSPHFPITKNKLFCDENKNIINGENYLIGFAGTKHISHNFIQLNHYFLKSKEEYLKRKSVPTPDRHVIPDIHCKENILKTFLKNNSYTNQIKNYKIFDIIEKNIGNYNENFVNGWKWHSWKRDN